ncbi:hypothetical protein AKJ16_DCAP03367 [Drosera capensis]
MKSGGVVNVKPTIVCNKCTIIYPHTLSGIVDFANHSPNNTIPISTQSTQITTAQHSTTVTSEVK